MKIVYGVLSTYTQNELNRAVLAHEARETSAQPDIEKHYTDKIAAIREYMKTDRLFFHGEERPERGFPRAYRLDPLPTTDILFRSAVSGAWYTRPGSAGAIDRVRVGRFREDCVLLILERAFVFGPGEAS